MPRQRYTISSMPLRAGLLTAGQQGTIPEQGLWEAKNCSSGLDGLLQKRPGLDQWGQTLKEPARNLGSLPVGAFSYVDDGERNTEGVPFNWNWSDFNDAIPALDVQFIDGRIILAATTATGDVVAYLNRGVYFQAEDTDSDYSLRFTMLAANWDTYAQLEFRIGGVAGTSAGATAWKIDDGDFYYWDGDWQSLFEYDFQDGGAICVEIR